MIAYSLPRHGGTHIDAPIHFAQGHQTVDQIPLERLIGLAVVIDVTEQSDRNADYQVMPDDIARFEQEHGAIPDDAIVLIRAASRGDGPMPRDISARPTRGAEAPANCISPVFIPMPRDG